MKPQKKSVKEITVGLFMLLTGIILFISAQTIEAGAEMSRGGDFLPKLMAGMLGICGILLIILAGPRKMETAKKTDALPFKQQLAGFLPTFILLVLYVFLLRPIGFLIMTALYIYLQSWLITPADKRKPVKLAVISGGTSVVIYGVFVFGLNLMLPAGILG